MSTHVQTRAAALVVAEPKRGRLGHRRSLLDRLGDASVIEHTLRRASRIVGIERIIVITGKDASWLNAVALHRFALPVTVFPHESLEGDEGLKRRIAARAWSSASWRGGLGGATVWDELLPADALHAACERHGLETAVMLGGDWCALDPGMTSAVLKLRADAPDAMKLCFAQAPPGLCGVAIASSTLGEMARAKAHQGFARALAYNPQSPTVDPIGKEACFRVSPAVRDTARRFIHDTPEARSRLHRLHAELGTRWNTSDAEAITQAARDLERHDPASVLEHLPPAGVTVELTPRRDIAGPIAVQSHLRIDRADMPPEIAAALMSQLGEVPVMLGGVGDAMLHPHWREMVQMLRDAGASAIGIETDLLNGVRDAEALIEASPDVVIVNVHADSAATYRAMTGVDAYDTVLKGAERLLNHAIAQPDHAARLVPRLTKVLGNTAEMDTFFERWWQIAGHALIERWPTGGSGSQALLADQSPVPMLGPWKPPSPHQRKQRVHVLSDGTVTLCSQDFLGRASLGNVFEQSLLECWQDVGRLAEAAQRSGWRHDDSPVCRRCFDWLSLRMRESPVLQEAV